MPSGNCYRLAIMPDMSDAEELPARKALIDHALDETFPLLYYFLPMMPSREMKVAGKAFTFTEPMSAVVWLIDLVTKRTAKKSKKEGYCLKKDLRLLVEQWYPPEEDAHSKDTTFTKRYGTLLNAGFVAERQVPHSRSSDYVWLTAEGQELLKEIKRRREPLIRKFFSLYAPQPGYALFARFALHVLVKRAWKIVDHQLQQTDPESFPDAEGR